MLLDTGLLVDVDLDGLLRALQAPPQPSSSDTPSPPSAASLPVTAPPLAGLEPAPQASPPADARTPDAAGSREMSPASGLSSGLTRPPIAASGEDAVPGCPPPSSAAAATTTTTSYDAENNKSSSPTRGATTAALPPSSAAAPAGSPAARAGQPLATQGTPGDTTPQPDVAGASVASLLREFRRSAAAAAELPSAPAQPPPPAVSQTNSGLRDRPAPEGSARRSGAGRGDTAGEQDGARMRREAEKVALKQRGRFAMADEDREDSDGGDDDWAQSRGAIKAKAAARRPHPPTHPLRRGCVIAAVALVYAVSSWSYRQGQSSMPYPRVPGPADEPR